MTGHFRQAPSRMRPPSTTVDTAAVSPRSSIRKCVSMALVTLAFAGCSVPVAILALHTAAYVFGR